MRGRGGDQQVFYANRPTRRAEHSARHSHRRPNCIGIGDRCRRASGSRPRRHPRHDFIREGTRADGLSARRRLRAQDDDREVVYAERPVNSERAQASARRSVRRGICLIRWKPILSASRARSSSPMPDESSTAAALSPPTSSSSPIRLRTTEQKLLNALAPKAQIVRATLDQLRRRAQEQGPAGLRCDAKHGATSSTTGSSLRASRSTRLSSTPAAAEIDRLLGSSIARIAFGDSTEKRREVRDDAQLRRALEILRQSQTQPDLFAVAQRANMAMKQE